MAKKNKDPTSEIPHVRPEPRPDFTEPPPREKLPDELQKLVDDDDDNGGLIDRIYDGTAGDTTSTSLRYAAYGSRIRTALMSAHRYVAYTSDVAESFRPVAHPYLVRGGYAVSWLYLVGDVSYEGYRAYIQNQRRLAADGSPAVVPLKDDYRTVVVQRAIFQSLASMGLPAFTIHSLVRYSPALFRHAKNTRIRSYGPIGLGLSVVPFLPYIFDKPVEEAVEWSVERVVKMVEGGGKGRKEKEL